MINYGFIEGFNSIMLNDEYLASQKMAFKL